MSSYTVFGCDPGGKNNFGIAWLELSDQKIINWSSNIVNTPAQASETITDAAVSQLIVLVSMDTFLYWSVKSGGLRDVDVLLRNKYPLSRNSVMSHNSTFGAMPVGGMSLAVMLARRFPKNLHLNEAHPKVLYSLLSGEKYNYKESSQNMCRFLFVELLELKEPMKPLSEHEFDALLCAYAGYMGSTGKYINQLPKSDLADALFLQDIPQPSFYWPEELE